MSILTTTDTIKVLRAVIASNGICEKNLLGVDDYNCDICQEIFGEDICLEPASLHAMALKLLSKYPATDLLECII